MDNQKSTEGKGSDASREGSSIGKNTGLNQGSSSLGNSQSGSSGSLGSSNASPSTAKPATGSSSGSIGGTSNSGSSQSSGNLGSSQSGSTGSSASSAAGSSGSIGSSTSGNSALGSSGSTSGGTSGSSLGSTTGGASGSSLSSTGSTDAKSSDSSSSGDQSQAQGGVKAALANVSPDKLHEKIDQVAQGAQPLVDKLVSTAHAGVDRISGMLSGASESLGQRKGQLGDTYSNYSEKSTEYVKTNPGTALLVAGAVGFLLAKLLSGSNDRRDNRYYRD